MITLIIAIIIITNVTTSNLFWKNKYEVRRPVCNEIKMKKNPAVNLFTQTIFINLLIYLFIYMYL